MKILKSFNQINKIIDRNNKKLVFFSGTFDLFHYGHFSALNKAAKLGDILLVQVDSNKLVKIRKGKDRPILDEQYRAQIISSLNFVNYVFISDKPSENSLKLLVIKPDIFIRAILPNESDDDRAAREKKLKSYMPHGKIVWLAQTPQISTTKIIQGLNYSQEESIIKVL